jgi:hypothetical protein
LEHDGPRVDAVVDQMDRAPRDLDSGAQRLPLGAKTGKSGKKRRMNVQGAKGKRREDFTGDDAKESGQTNGVDLGFPERAQKCIRSFARPGAALRSGRKDAGFDSVLARFVQDRGALPIAQEKRNAGGISFALGRAAECVEVAPSPRRQDRDAQ